MHVLSRAADQAPGPIRRWFDGSAAAPLELIVGPERYASTLAQSFFGFCGATAVPCEDPAGKAVQLARRLVPALDSLAARWARRGHHLGYGIGVAFGYATLGTVGVEGRTDYTALGTVVNLASRLCGEAASGEVLLDAGTCDASIAAVETAPVDLTLKGFPSPVRAHRLLP